MKNLMKLLIAGIILYAITTENVIAQTITNFWNGQMQNISKSKSIPGWVYFKDDIYIDPNTIFTTNKTAFGLGVYDEMVIYRTETDQLGYTHYRYQQQYKGVKIEGCEYIVHSYNGYSLKANGKIVQGLNLNDIPSVSETNAFNIALNYVNADVYMWEDSITEQLLKDFKNDINATYYPQAELVITRTSENTDFIPENFHLAYKFDIYAKEPMSRNYIYVDAIDGEVIKEINRIHNSWYDVEGTAETRYSGTQTITTQYSDEEQYYRLRESGRGNGIITWNTINWKELPQLDDFIDDDNYWDNLYDNYWYNLYDNKYEVSTDVHWATEKTYDYYLTKFGRNSIDDNGYELTSLVHFLFCYWWGCTRNNAAWNGDWMLYGDGDGISFTPLTSVDIVAHEITHGLTEFTVDLEYSYESGSLNESFSDIFGACIEYYAKPSDANWRCGEDVTVNGLGLRNMANPNEFNDPDTYWSNEYWHWESYDYGGVHTNNGVQNHWFYLLSEGSSATDEINDDDYVFSLTGIGIEKAADIAYRNLTVYLISSSNYFDARRGSIEAAADLFGDCSFEVDQTVEAWNAVGVYCTGPWEPFEYMNNYTATESDVWEPGDNPFNDTFEDVIIRNNLTIPAGIDITIKDMTFRFGPAAEVIVERGTSTLKGAKLTLNHTAFTSYECSQIIFWKGIEVWGYPDETQSSLYTKQGCLILENNSMIENANVGVLLAKRGYFFEGLNYTGGIIWATNSTFKNNHRSVNFLPYHNIIMTFQEQLGTNVSYFKNCIFETTPKFKIHSGVPLIFVSMWGVDGIKFLGNEFDIGALPVNKWINSTGIFSIDASFTVKPLCLSQDVPCTNLKPNIFWWGPYYGIIAINSNSLNTVTIDNTKFYNSIYRAILLSGVDFATITNNEFHINICSDDDCFENNPYSTSLNYPYGLYLEGCTGYKVEENVFYPSGYNSNIIGTIITESGDEYNEIYNNTFNNLWYSFIAYDDNDGPGYYDGLEILCNNFVSNDYDIYVISDNENGDISNQQGKCENNNTTTPAGNRFSHTCGNSQNDFYVDKPSEQTILYCHHSDYITTPQCFDDITEGGKVFANDCFVDFVPGNGPGSSCPSNLNQGYEIIKENINYYSNKIKESKALINGGDTQYLLDIIEQGNPGHILKIIKKYSPYITDKVLIAAINSLLPPGIVQQIIIANSPVSEQVMNALNNISTPLPGGIINQINVAQTGTSAMAELNIDIAYYESRKENTENELIRLFLNDTTITITAALDSVAKILKTSEKESRRRKSVCCLIKQREYAKAEQELNILYADSVYDNFYKLMSVLIELEQDTAKALALKTDIVKEQLVREIAADTIRKTHFYAQNILKLVFEESFPEKIVFPSQNNNKMASFEDNEVDNIPEETILLDENHKLRCFPNPFSDYTTIEAYVPENIYNSEIVIYNILGIVTKRYELKQGYNAITVLKDDIGAEGIYFYALKFNEQFIEKSKMVIIK